MPPLLPENSFRCLDETDNESAYDDSSDSSDHTEADLTFDDVVREEFAILTRNRQERARLIGKTNAVDDNDGPRFALAFSGGGVRAAAFEAGVLWRLGEAGCLKNVEHFCVVSGGAYIASAFASHIIAESAPRDGDLDSWYLSIVAKTIVRMQDNISYIVGDFIHEPCFVPADGSRTMPRLCDLPILLCYILFTLLYNPLTLFIMYVIPFVELTNAMFGFYLRVALCNIRSPRMSLTDIKFLEYSPFMKYCVIVILLLLVSVIVLNFFCWTVGEVCTRWRVRQPFEKTRSRCPCFLWVTSAQAMLIRLAVLLAICLAAVMGMFICEVGAGWTYRGSCADYVDTVLSPINGSGSVARCTDRFLFGLHPVATNCTRCVGEYKWPAACPEWCQSKGPDDLTDELNDHLVRYGEVVSRWHTPGIALLGYVILCVLVLAMLFVPVFGVKLLKNALMIVGPVVVIFFVGCVLAFRIFGPVTGQWFPCLHWLRYDDHAWDALSRYCVLVGAVLVPIHPWFLSSMHTYYRRSLRMAFFQEGEDITWADVRQNCFCPFLIMTGTVSDYVHPDYENSTSEIFFSSAFMGGQKIGYVETSPWISVAKCMALTGAASDAAVLGVLSKKTYSFHRFWLDATNLRMGDNLFFEREPQRLKRWALQQEGSSTPRTVYEAGRRARHSSCQCEEGCVRCLDRMPTLILQELVYLFLYLGLHLMKSDEFCFIGRKSFFFGAVIQLVLYMLSFFAFVRFLECTLFSNFNKRAHMALGYKHEAYTPPRHIYVTDGGVMDPSGVLELLRRRCKRILVVQSVNDPRDELVMLKRTLSLAEAEHLASFYDPRDPMVGIEYVYDAFQQDDSITYLHIGVRYDAKSWQNKSELGHLFIVKLRLPHDLKDAVVPPLLSEQEIVGESVPNMVCEDLGHLKQTELGGCWCSCCHRNGCNIGKKFPHVSNSNQSLTLELFSCLCRLGHHISEGAVKALCEADPYDPSNISALSLEREFCTKVEDLQRAEDRQGRLATGFI